MKKTIGIIGGMGPEATCDLFKKIIKHTNAKADNEHIHIIIDNNTNIPDRTAAIKKQGTNPVAEILSSAEKLEKAGADLLIMPCNTAHTYYDDISKKCSIPLINMVEETVKEVQIKKYSNACVLATDGSILSKVYEKTLKNHSIKPIIPNAEEQNVINNMIYKGIKAGNTNYDGSKFRKTIENISKRDTDVFILACTELPIAIERYNVLDNFIDSSEILARAAIINAGYDYI